MGTHRQTRVQCKLEFTYLTQKKKKAVEASCSTLLNPGTSSSSIKSYSHEESKHTHLALVICINKQAVEWMKWNNNKPKESKCECNGLLSPQGEDFVWANK